MKTKKTNQPSSRQRDEVNIAALRYALGTALGLEGRYCEVGGYEVTVIRAALKATEPK